MKVQSLLLLLTSVLAVQITTGQPIQEEECCSRKTVGNVEYALVDEIDTSRFNCLTNCIYEADNNPGSRFCFASGSLPVDCGDRSTGWDMICNYYPKSDVREHWKLDKDQKDFQTYLAPGSEDWSKAKAIYQDGAHSMKTSDVTLNTALAQEFEKGDAIEQGAKTGQLNKKAYVGNLTIKVGIDPPCISPRAVNPDTSGCFTEDGGSFKIKEIDVGTASDVNLKYRTLAKFSTEADSKMNGTMFLKYKAYYGVGDYADRYIMAALDASDETGTNVNMDFTSKDNEFRAESAMKGSTFWSVWMYLIWEMEDAIGDCEAGCSDCNDAPVHAWDEAWAFYTGSLEGEFGSTTGIFPYRHAETMCAILDTCLASKSRVNRDLEDAFIEGKNNIDSGNCAGAIAFKQTIMTKMSIPLIQGALYSAYKIAIDGDTTSKRKAEAAAFAGSILPQIADCNADDATTIKNNLWIDASSLDFAAVKNAFEKNYVCLGVTCDDIGGMGSGTDFEKCTSP